MVIFADILKDLCTCYCIWSFETLTLVSMEFFVSNFQVDNPRMNQEHSNTEAEVTQKLFRKYLAG